MAKKILCYGDSNTWGYMPVTGRRFPEEARWPGVLRRELGEGYLILEDGVCGRTTVWEEPYCEGRHGVKGLGYAVHRERPLDMMIVMLGTNDLNYTDAFGYYKGISVLVNHILHADIFYPWAEPAQNDGFQLLLVSPVTLAPDIAAVRPECPIAGCYGESAKFARYTRQAAEEFHIPWFDAAAVARTEARDCVHMDAENHRRLGMALAREVRKLMPV